MCTIRCCKSTFTLLYQRGTDAAAAAAADDSDNDGDDVL